MQDIRGQMWMEGKGRRHTDLSQMWDLTSTFLSLSFPHTLLTFSLPGARSWNVQVSLIYARKLGLIWNQGTSSLSLSSAEIIGIRHFRYHPAFLSLLVTTLSPSGLCLASQQGSHLVPTRFLHQLCTSGHKPHGIFSGCLWCVHLFTHSFNKYFYFLKF